ncbi:hypothetical protein [Helicobacter sp. T3_23-1059]
MTTILTLENPSDELLRAFKNMAKAANVKCKIGKKSKEPKYYTLEDAPAIRKITRDFEALPKNKQDEIRAELEAELAGYANGN